MDSMYSALLQALTDEDENATPPPLPTDVPVKEPGGAPALAAPPVDPAVPAAPAAPRDTPAPTATLGERFGMRLEDAMPAPRAQNEMFGPAMLSRAGSQLGAALAGGLKPDTSTSEILMQKGAKDAAGIDAQHDEMTKFKQALMMRLEPGKKTARGKDYNADLANPASEAWQRRYAMLASTDAGKRTVDKYIENVRAAGGVPDLNEFDLKLSNGLAADTSTANSERAQAGAGARQVAGFGQGEKMAQVGQGYALDRETYAQELKRAAEQRNSTIPDRPMVKPERPPPAASAEKVRAVDADTRFLVPAIDDLITLIKQNPDTRVVPGLNDKLDSLTQTIASTLLHVRHYGVPNGKDWEMVFREVGEPTQLRDIVLNRAVNKLEEVRKNAVIQSDATAQAYGYGAFAPGSGAAQPLIPAARPAVRSPRDVVRDNIRPPAAAPAVQEVQSARFRLNGKVLRVPADKLEQFQKDYPEAEAL